MTRATSPPTAAALDVYRRDTIVALATPRGRGAIAVIRISGDDAFAVADRLFVAAHGAEPGPWLLRLGTVRDPASGQEIDEALSVRMPGPATYTGEDVVELHTHGSPVIVERVLEVAMACGARPADRGEYTRRAVLNGKMDLTQAEAVMDLIDAPVASAARAAWGQLQGALGERLGVIRAAVVDVLADVEANVDFSDDELPLENDVARLDRLRTACDQVDGLLAGYVIARRQRDGWRVALTGRPNAGKSSIVNRLLGYGRMIVSEEAGTTRDCVEEVVDLDGYAFVLTDTAGIRATDSAAEAAAVARARQAAADADVAVVVIDGSQAPSQEDVRWIESLRGRPAVAVINKIDLPDGFGRGREILARAGTAIVETSALTGAGFESLVGTLRDLVRQEMPSDEQPIGITRGRHRDALHGARRHLRAARALLGENAGTELVAMELRDSLAQLGSITDPLQNEEVLDRIFESFCIGK